MRAGVPAGSSSVMPVTVDRVPCQCERYRGNQIRAPPAWSELEAGGQAAADVAGALAAGGVGDAGGDADAVGEGVHDVVGDDGAAAHVGAGEAGRRDPGAHE